MDLNDFVRRRGPGAAAGRDYEQEGTEESGGPFLLKAASQIALSVAR